MPLARVCCNIETYCFYQPHPHCCFVLRLSSRMRYVCCNLLQQDETTTRKLQNQALKFNILLQGVLKTRATSIGLVKLLQLGAPNKPETECPENNTMQVRRRKCCSCISQQRVIVCSVPVKVITSDKWTGMKDEYKLLVRKNFHPTLKLSGFLFFHETTPVILYYTASGLQGSE